MVIVAIHNQQIITIDPSSQRHQRYQLDKLHEILSGKFLRLYETRETPEANRIFGIGWLKRRASAYHQLLIHIIIASLVMQIFATAMPLFSQVVIDKVLVHHNLSALYVLGAGMLILTIFEFVLTALRTQQQAHIACKIDLSLGQKIKAQLLRLPLHYFQSRSKGHILGLFKELDTVRHFITSSSATSLVDISFLIVFLPLMYFYSPALTVITVVTSIVMMTTSFLFNPEKTRRMDDHSKAIADCQNSLIENIAGIGSVKALAAEPVMQRRWENAYVRNVLTTMRNNNAQAISHASSNFVQRLSTLAILWIGASLVLENQLSVGQLIAFQMLSARVLHPIMRMSQLWHDLKQVKHSMDRLGDIMNFPLEENNAAGNRIVSPNAGDIEINNLYFSYPRVDTPALRYVSLSIPFGKKVALLGRSGSGKSTLVKLLTRMYNLEHGLIRYDGVDIRTIDLSVLRNRITLVPQDSELFNGTIAENISIHVPWVNMDKIVWAARCVGADEFINNLKSGYETLVGGNGLQLSGGQRQRIALARAILGEPDVLILDESTSALDYESEMHVLENIFKHFVNRTVVIITHRLHIIKKVDLIHMLVDGNLAESVTHKELMLKSVSYSNLFNADAENNLEEAA